MSINKSDIEHLCNLSKLKLEEDEKAVFLEQMQSILKMIEELQELETEGISPMAHPLEMAQRLRADEVLSIDRREQYQKNTEHTESGFYKVPKVIE
jgi:aspartyl-tRNA(Asn)/glutamyl-tRNA(Gln) amidotransferase subunit C